MLSTEKSPMGAFLLYTYSMPINVSGRMARKSTVRDTSGNIINMMDEADGGWIIRNRQVVNQEKYQKMLDIEEDKKIAARAMAEQITRPDAPDRTVVPGKMEALEKRIDSQDAKLDAILAALSKK